MLTCLNSSEVRKRWSCFFDQVIRQNPIMIKRNRDFITALSIDQLKDLLKPYQFSLKIEKEDDGTYTGFLKEIDLACNASTPSEVITQLAKDVHEYATEYMEEFDMYYHSPNRKPHFPYVLSVLMQPNAAAVEKMIHA